MIAILAACAPISPLAGSPSAYVRQHASDPVPWRIWGPEVFEEARRRDQLVFVTVGFAACHWCHVLQHESFRDPEIAAALAARFVPVVVDREERPDVDQELQIAMRSVSGKTGWPATLVLTPSGDVAFAAGYLPPRGGVGLLDVLTRLADAWASDRERFAAEAAANTALVRAASERRVAADAAELIERYRGAYDPVHGGFGGAPKFPNLPLLRLAVDLAALGDAEWRDIAAHTGRALAEGGLRDPIGGGFHRYTVDAAWQTPHFEKLTVENAQLATWFADLGALTGDAAFAAVGAETLGALRAFERPDGTYANALDATGTGPDGAPIEGLYYTWTPEELFALGPTARVLGEPVAGRRLVIPAPADLPRFRAARAARTPPRADDLWLAATQAEVVRALVRAGELERALRLADRIRAEVRDDSVWRSGRPGLLEDDAIVATAWLDLFEATADPRWLDGAVALMDRAEERFADPAGGWFRAEGDGVWGRPKDKADPGGTSLMIHAALRLSALTEAPRWRARAERALGAGILANQPLVVDAAVLAAHDPPQIVIAWPEGADPAPMLAAARGAVWPGRALVAGPNGALAALQGRVPLADGKVAAQAATAWVCRRGVCAPPTTDPAAMVARARGE